MAASILRSACHFRVTCRVISRSFGAQFCDLQETGRLPLTYLTSVPSVGGLSYRPVTGESPGGGCRKKRGASISPELPVSYPDDAMQGVTHGGSPVTGR